MKILVAGGGIAGLGAAVGLARLGHDIHLFEQAQAIEEVGAGLQMSPNGVRALQHLGAWEAIAPSCVIPSEIHVRDGRTGAFLQRIRLGKPFESRFGAPYRVCHRADLLGGLLRTAQDCRNISLNTGQRAVDSMEEPEAIRLQLESGQMASGELLIAADGIRSRLRQRIGGGILPAYRGHAIHRALIPFEQVPPDIEADCITLWLLPGGHVVHYPVSNWRSFNIVAAIDSPQPGEGWGDQDDGHLLRGRIGSGDETLAQLLAVPRSWLVWQGADLPDIPVWVSRRTALIGDAAHATLPYLAQGAVMSLEDACVLASVMAQRGLPEALQKYQELRQARCGRIQAESRRLGNIYHAAGLKALARNAALRLMGPEAAMNRNRWIYEWTP